MSDMRLVRGEIIFPGPCHCGFHMHRGFLAWDIINCEIPDSAVCDTTCSPGCALVAYKRFIEEEFGGTEAIEGRLSHD